MEINSLGQLKDSIDGFLSVFGIDASDCVGNTINLAMVGATSVGKSLTINSIINRDVCKVGHVGNTTRNASWVPYHLSNSTQPDFRLLDLPGWGVSKRIDSSYEEELKINLPEADSILWIIRADAIGTLTYDMQWLGDIILPSIGNDISKIVVGINQIENVHDNIFYNGKPSKILIETLDKKCTLIYNEILHSFPGFKLSQLQPYSAKMSHRIIPLLNSLVVASGDNGWILQLISNISKETDSFYK